MKIASFFSGGGGLDLGFHLAGFQTIWANEYDKTIWATFRKNFPDAHLETRSLTELSFSELPSGVDGFIGGPPCQSWSAGGAKRGIEDPRGQLFFDYIKMIKGYQPRFFLAENVPGILAPRNEEAFERILGRFQDIGYDVSYKQLNAYDYGVPQDRKRVIIIGMRKDLEIKFDFPEPSGLKLDLRSSISDLPEPKSCVGNEANDFADEELQNHEYMLGGFSSMYMSRNRVRGWDEPSFTIQAGGRHAPLHPQAPKMVKVGEDKFEFVQSELSLYRRLSVRECARIQTFPDSHIFIYNRILDGYKMIGNAVPVELSRHLASAIKAQLS